MQLNKLIIYRTKKLSSETLGEKSRIENINGATLLKFITIEPAECIPAGKYFYKKCLASNIAKYEHLLLDNGTSIMRLDENSLHNISVCKNATDQVVIDSAETLAEILDLLPDQGVVLILEDF